MPDREDDPLRIHREDVPDELLSGDGRRPAALIAGVFGALLHLAAGALILATGLLAPPWAVGAFAGLWVAGAWLMVRWRRRWPLLVLLVPFAVLGVVWLALTAGDVWLGWTA